MIWYVLQAATALYTLIKGVKEYRKLERIYSKLTSTALTNVAQLQQILKNKKPLERFFVVVKGIAKAHEQAREKNILSIIHEKDLRIKPLILNAFQKVSWSKIIEKPLWRRPWNLKNIHFYLKDLTENKTIQISNCQNSQITGALTEVFSDKVIFPPSTNSIVRFLKVIYTMLSNLFPFNIFLDKLKYGQQLQYYGILDGQFTLAIGQAYKNQNGSIFMKKPYYLTKQKSFIQTKIKTKINYLYWVLLLISLIKIYALYQIIKKGLKIFWKKKQSKQSAQQQDKRSQDEGQFANCIICYTNIRSIVLKPCRHYGFCNQCYQAFTTKGCPLCKTQITGIIKIIKKK